MQSRGNDEQPPRDNPASPGVSSEDDPFAELDTSIDVLSLVPQLRNQRFRLKQWGDSNQAEAFNRYKQALEPYLTSGSPSLGEGYFGQILHGVCVHGQASRTHMVPARHDCHEAFGERLRKFLENHRLSLDSLGPEPGRRAIYFIRKLVAVLEVITSQWHDTHNGCRPLYGLTFELNKWVAMLAKYDVFWPSQALLDFISAKKMFFESDLRPGLEPLAAQAMSSTENA